MTLANAQPHKVYTVIRTDEGIIYGEQKLKI